MWAAILMCSVGAASASPIVVNGRAVAQEFDGHGGLSAGATTRLLVDYPLQQQSEVLDYLFTPGFGASLAVLKVEIGGDTQSTDGTEASHMHFRGDLGCKRGYEGWLAAEAKKRNPEIKIWSLSWGVPEWVGNNSYFSDDNIEYQVAWLKCLRDSWGVDSDYLGLWNERPQGSVDYVLKLRAALNDAGFRHVGITIESTWQPLVNQVLTNATFNASLVAATKHYPCNTTTEAAVQARLKFWAGEDTPTWYGNWTGASCWGRKLSQHWVNINSTSSVAWAVLWSAYPGVTGRFGDQGDNFHGNAFLTAVEPWSGHYSIPPVLWINAHWGQFVTPGWRFLEIGPGGGSWLLPEGGSYVTLIPPEKSPHPDGTFVMIVETLLGTCDGKCDVPYQSLGVQNLEFDLSGSIESSTTVNVWCSSSEAIFVNKGALQIASGVLKLTMQPDTICTLTTLNNGTKGSHPTPPSSRPFPSRHDDDFSKYADDELAWGFSDVYGSFSVRDHTLSQLATGHPDGWAPVNYDPLTFIGDPTWKDLHVSASAIVNQSAPVGQYVRLCGGCTDQSIRSIKYACAPECCFNVSAHGDWIIGSGQDAVTGQIAGFEDTWHAIDMKIYNGTVTASVDGKQVAKAEGICTVAGMVGLGCGSYHQCAFRNFTMSSTSTA